MERRVTPRSLGSPDYFCPHYSVMMVLLKREALTGHQMVRIVNDDVKGLIRRPKFSSQRRTACSAVASSLSNFNTESRCVMRSRSPTRPLALQMRSCPP
jgi:hypothetical protein